MNIDNIDNNNSINNHTEDNLKLLLPKNTMKNVLYV